VTTKFLDPSFFTSMKHHGIGITVVEINENIYLVTTVGELRIERSKQEKLP
jgi:hypothetical protein